MLGGRGVGSRGGGAVAGVKGEAAVTGRVNGRAAAGAGDGIVGCVEMDVGTEEPHVGSFEGT